MNNTDTALIHRTLDGDDNAFAELVKKYQKQVHALIWRKMGDFHIAEELTQDVFLKAYQRLATLKKPQSFASWLYVIASNDSSTWLRKKRLWTQSLEDTSGTQLEKATYSGYVIEENERAAAEAQRDVVKKLLAKLQESERTVMTLYYFGEMTCREISEFLGVSVGAIKSRLDRARHRLEKEEPMIREALEHFQITPHLTENIMREIARTKPIAPSGGKPFVPWAVAVSAITVVFLMLGVGNQYLAHFQKPYSFDAASEMTVDIIEAPLVLNLASKPDVRAQLGNTDASDKRNVSNRQSNDTSALAAETHSNKTIENHPQWALPPKAKARLGKGDIRAIQFSPDGTQLAVGGSIGVWLYDVKTGKTLSLFAGICQSLIFSPDGRFLVNSGRDFSSNPGASRRKKGIEVWEVATDDKVPLRDVPPAAVVLHFAEDSKTLVSLSKSRDTISRLDIETGKRTENQLADRLGNLHSEVYALMEDKIAIGSNNGKITLWDTNTGRKLSTIRERTKMIQLPNYAMADNNVLALAFSPDGTRLASTDRDSVNLWDTISDTAPITLQKHTNYPAHYVLAFSPDGKMLAGGSEDSTVQLWDTTTREPIVTFSSHFSDIVALAFSPDGNTLVSGSSDGTVRFWNIKTGEPLKKRISGHLSWLRGVTFYEDNFTIASVAYNGIITLWDLNKSEKTMLQTQTTLEGRWRPNWYPDFAFSPDGTKLVSFGIDSNSPNPWFNSELRLTDVNTGRELATSPEGASDLTFSPDGKIVAGSRSNSSIRLWNTETGKKLDLSLLDPNAAPEEQHQPIIRTLVFSPDGKKLAGGTMGGHVQMWDVETGVALTTFFGEETPVDHTYRDPILRLAFSSDSSLLAIGSLKQIRMLGNLRQIGFKEVSYGAEAWGEALMFSPDNTVLITGLVNANGIELWDLTTGNRLTTLKGHTHGVEALAFSPDNKTLVSTGGDGTILLWDWEEILTTARNKDKNREVIVKSLNNESPLEKTLKFVERTAETEANARYILTLEQTHLKNKWKNALEQFKSDLDTTTFGSSQRQLYAQIAEMGKNTEDKARYVDMLNKLMDAMPDKPGVQLNIHLLLAEFYRDNDMPEKAEAHIQKTGFIIEDEWLILGPFDNTNGIGYNTAYISEDAKQIDATAKYEGIDGKVRWEKSTDDTLNAYINLGEDVDWGVAYAFTTVISPDKREILFRFDSDDEGTIWLNGEKVFTHTKSHSATIDRYTIPVTLRSGENNILVKVCEAEGGWGFYLRITDIDGNPFDDLKITRPNKK